MTLLPRLLSHRAAFYALRLLCSASENLSDQSLLRLIIDQQVLFFRLLPYWQHYELRHGMKISDLRTIKPTLIQGLVALGTFVEVMLNLIRFLIDSEKFDPP